MAYQITEKCTGCTHCVLNCPTGAIHGDPRLLHVIDPGRCIDCGACGVICPDEAVCDNQGLACTRLKPSRPVAHVDLGACTGCGWCIEACPFDALLAAPGHATVDEQRCVACHGCELGCPHDAIRVYRREVQEVPAALCLPPPRGQFLLALAAPNTGTA